MTRPPEPAPAQDTAEPAPEGVALTYALLVSEGGRALVRTLPSSGAVIIGRDRDCEIHIDDPSLSRRHARIHAGLPPQIEDLRSRNGTRLAGKVLKSGEQYPLSIGSVIQAGTALIVVQRAGMTTTTPSARAAPSLKQPVVRDPTMLRLYQLVDIIAPSSIPVLILGETGVGKEVYAEAVHARSPRSAQPFLRLNCAALPESILESELFGHEKGAFTGATRTKVGLLESANLGSVFLDEVGELALPTQAKLLRFLEAGEFLRVGSVKPTRVDVRIMSATNRDLQQHIAERAFRADLYFRLNGIAVTLPPLRQRPDDVLALAEQFMQLAATRAGSQAPGLDASAVAALREHSWPGNVRELRNVIERAVLLAQGRPIEAETLGLEVARPAAALRPDVEAFERTRIQKALDECGGNQKLAAELLGIGRRTLLTKLDQYGIARPRKRR